MNAFMLWAKGQRHEVGVCLLLCSQPAHKLNLAHCQYKKLHPNAHNAAVSKYLGEQWNRLAPEVKVVFAERARAAKDEHMSAHPGYKYCPRRRFQEPPRASPSPPLPLGAYSQSLSRGPPIVCAPPHPAPPLTQVLDPAIDDSLARLLLRGDPGGMLLCGDAGGVLLGWLPELSSGDVDAALGDAALSLPPLPDDPGWLGPRAPWGHSADAGAPWGQNADAMLHTAVPPCSPLSVQSTSPSPYDAARAPAVPALPAAPCPPRCAAPVVPGSGTTQDDGIATACTADEGSVGPAEAVCVASVAPDLPRYVYTETS